jgi:SnoaL-like domain
VRSILDAWNRRDYSAALEPVAPDIKLESALGGGLDGTYEGIPDLQKWLARFWGSFEDFRTEIEECFPVEEASITSDSVSAIATALAAGTFGALQVRPRLSGVC